MICCYIFFSLNRNVTLTGYADEKFSLYMELGLCSRICNWVLNGHHAGVDTFPRNLTSDLLRDVYHEYELLSAD
jgi:hypothetical protein